MLSIGRGIEASPARICTSTTSTNWRLVSRARMARAASLASAFPRYRSGSVAVGLWLLGQSSYQVPSSSLMPSNIQLYCNDGHECGAAQGARCEGKGLCFQDVTIRNELVMVPLCKLHMRKLLASRYPARLATSGAP